MVVKVTVQVFLIHKKALPTDVVSFPLIMLFYYFFYSASAVVVGVSVAFALPFTRVSYAVNISFTVILFTRNTLLILSILVDTFISKISLTMQPGPKIDSISGA